LPWQHGSIGVHFCDIDKLHYFDNPLIGATYLALRLTLAESWLILY